MNSKGFTLLEVVFSMAIFGIILAGMPGFFVTQMHFNTESQRRTEAIGVAKRRLDFLRVQDPQALPTSGSEGPDSTTINGRDFEIMTYYCEEAAYCATANNRHIRVEVSFKDRIIHEVETVFTRLQ